MREAAPEEGETVFLRQTCRFSCVPGRHMSLPPLWHLQVSNDADGEPRTEGSARWGQQSSRSDAGPLQWIGTSALAEKQREGETHYSCDMSTKTSVRSPTFGLAVLAIWREQDLDRMDSFLLLPLPWWTSVVWSSAVWPVRCLPPTPWYWFWVRLRPHMNFTENSSPEGKSFNAARPSSDLMVVSPLGPNSALQEDHSGHLTSESMLKNGCRNKILHENKKYQHHCWKGWENHYFHIPSWGQLEWVPQADMVD